MGKKRKVGELYHKTIVEGDENLVRGGVEIHINNLSNNNSSSKIIADCILEFCDGTSYHIYASTSLKTIMNGNYIFTAEGYLNVYYNVEYDGEIYDCLAILSYGQGTYPYCYIHNLGDYNFSLISITDGQETINYEGNDRVLIKQRYNGVEQKAIIKFNVTTNDGNIIKFLIASNIDISDDIKLL